MEDAVVAMVVVVNKAIHCEFMHVPIVSALIIHGDPGVRSAPM